MPSIPTYQSTNGIKVGNTPELNLSSVNSSKQAQGNLSQAIKNVGENFAEVEAARGKVRDFRQKNEASILTLNGISEITALSNEDPDFDPTPYEEAIDKKGQEAAKTITNQLAKEEFMANFQRQATVAKWDIRNKFRDRELKSAVESGVYKGKQISSIYTRLSQAEKNTAVLDFKKTLMDGVKAKVYTQSQVNQIDADFQKDIKESVVNAHILANPEAAKAGLEQGKDGPYPDISEEFRTDSIVKADAYDKKYKAEAEAKQKELINTNEDNIVTRMIDPQKEKPTEGEIVTMMNSENPEEKISPRFAKAVIENIRSAKKYKKSNKVNTTFNKLAGDILDPKNKKEDEIRNELLSKNAVGELDDSDFQTLYTFFTGVKKDTVDKAMPKKTWMERLFNNGKDKGLRQEVITGMFKQYMQKVNNGDDPAKAVSEIINTHLDNHLAEEAKKPNRQYATNPQTKQRIYSEDNGTTWYDEKTKELIK